MLSLFAILYTVAVIGFAPDNGTVTEGVDRSLNLTFGMISGELGLDLLVELVLVPGGTATSILRMHDILVKLTVTVFDSIFQMKQILCITVDNFSPLVRLRDLIHSPLILLMMTFLKLHMKSFLLVSMQLNSVDCIFVMSA